MGAVGNMRRITLLLPALLVVFLSGQARAEASEVEAAQPPHVLPLKEEVASRDVREADKKSRIAKRKLERQKAKDEKKTKLKRKLNTDKKNQVTRRKAKGRKS